MPSATLYFSAAIAVTIAIIGSAYAWRHRRTSGALPLAGLFTCITIWSIAYILTLATPDLAGKYFWSKFGYLGASFACYTWLIFSLEYIGHGSWLNVKRIVLLAIIPTLTILLVYTNDLHGLIWTRIWLEENIRVSHGPWYYVFIAYSYALFLVGLSLLVWKFYRLKAPFSYQIVTVSLGGLLVILWSVYYITFAKQPLPPEYTPMIINISCFCFAFGLFHFRLLDISPVPSDVVVESMQDGLLVADALDRVVEMNRAAENIFGFPFTVCIGRPINELIPNWQNMNDVNNDQEQHTAELSLQKDGQEQIFELRTSPIKFNKGASGRLAFLTDITARKQVQIAAREQRNLADALRDSAAALNSTLQLDEVLDRILTNIGRVLPYDSVEVLLIEDNHARVVRSQANVLLDHATIQNISPFALDAVPDYRKMATTGKSIVTPDIRLKPDWILLPGTEWIRSLIATPICIRDEVIGFLSVNSSVPGFYTEAYADRLEAFADQAAIAIENARMFSEREQQALTDSLSGLYNRRALFDIGQREVERSLRLNHPLSAVMIDIDRFKAINDTYGHLVGDDVIRALVKLMHANVRSIDLIGRLGGDEFIIILLENGQTDGCRIAERIRRGVENIRLQTAQGSVHFTISLGVAELSQDAANLVDLISVADNAMYSAKMNGRNQVFTTNRVRVDFSDEIL